MTDNSDFQFINLYLNRPHVTLIGYFKALLKYQIIFLNLQFPKVIQCLNSSKAFFLLIRFVCFSFTCINQVRN